VDRIVATAWRGHTGPGLRHNKIMIISSPYVIILSADEHHELTVRASSARAAHRDVVRATIILAPPGADRTPGSLPISASTSTPSGNGADGSASTGWPV